MEAPKITRGDRTANVVIAATLLFLVGFFAWQPVVLLFLIASSSGYRPDALPLFVLVCACIMAIVSFSVLFAARAFRGRHIKNIPRVISIINATLLFLFDMYMLLNSGATGLTGFFFYVIVIMVVFIPLAIAVAVLSIIGNVSLLLPPKKKSKV